LEFLNQHPENFINMDETSFEINSRPDKVLTSTEIPHTLDRDVTGHHKRVTATVTIGADGRMWTPQLILKTGCTKLSDLSYAAGCEFLALLSVIIPCIEYFKRKFDFITFAFF
jgi:hypothetical protein